MKQSIYIFKDAPTLNLAHKLIEIGDVESVANLCKTGRINPNQLICYAAMCGEADIVQELLNLGANPNHASKAGVPAIVYAAASGSVDCLSILLRAGVRNSMVVSLRELNNITCTGTVKVLVKRLANRTLKFA